MNIYYKFDDEGRWIPGEEVISKSKPEGNYTGISIPQPNWKPVFQNGEWIETATEEEKNPPVSVEPSPLEKLQQEQELMRQALDELILGGGGI